MAYNFTTDSDLTRPHPWCGPVSVDALATSRLAVVFATVILNVGVVALLTLAQWSDWRTGLALSLADNTILLWFIIRQGDTFLARLIFYGLAVGYTELAVDAWLVDRTHTLDYSIGGGPMIWRSPIWMPLAWEVVAVQFSCIGLWLWQRFGKLGLLAVGLLGAANIPYYEQMARSVHWWQYRACRMLSGTPYYVITAELIIAINLTLLAKPILRQARLVTTLALGFAAGLTIFASCALTYCVFEVWKVGVR